MTNSIWKTPDQEQKYNEEVLIEYIGVSGRPFYEFDDFVRRLPNLKRWCYITDLIAQADKAERLQKAVAELYLEIDEFFANLKGGFYEPKNVDAQRKLGDLRIKLQRLKKSNN